MTDPASPNEADWVLQHLINVICRNDTPFGLTVTVGGALVSGIVISPGAWIEAIANVDGGRGSDLASHLESFATEKIGDEDELDDDDVEYLHMREARYLGANGWLPAADGCIWRARINQITSWSVGVMGRRPTGRGEVTS